MPSPNLRSAALERNRRRGHEGTPEGQRRTADWAAVRPLASGEGPTVHAAFCEPERRIVLLTYAFRGQRFLTGCLGPSTPGHRDTRCAQSVAQVGATTSWVAGEGQLVTSGCSPAAGPSSLAKARHPAHQVAVPHPPRPVGKLHCFLGEVGPPPSCPSQQRLVAHREHLCDLSQGEQVVVAVLGPSGRAIGGWVGGHCGAAGGMASGVDGGRCRADSLVSRRFVGASRLSQRSRICHETAGCDDVHAPGAGASGLASQRTVSGRAPPAGYISAKVGLARNSLYRYFRDKASILL